MSNRNYTHGLRDFVDLSPLVTSWFEKKAKGSKNTAEVYASQLFRYWKDVLKPKGYKDISQWVDEVKEQQFSRDVTV